VVIRAVCAFLEIPTEIVTDVSEYEALEVELTKSDSDVKAFYIRQQQLSISKPFASWKSARMKVPISI